MAVLGVFEDIYGVGAEMTPGRALLISLVGFLLVFLILGFLALFIKALGKGFDAAGKKQKKAPEPAPEVPVPAPAAPVGKPLPPTMSAGTLVLEDVSEEEAAIIMAITSEQTGIPLNRLEFHSIKRLKEGQK